MKTSITRGARIGALGVASALALGGAFIAPAAAEEGAVAPTDGAAFDQLAQEFFQDDTVKGVVYDSTGHVYVQQLEAGAASAPLDAGIAAKLAEQYQNVTIVPADEEDLAKPAASTDVVGGAGIALLGADGDGGVCSVGFPAWTPDGEPAVITAGHCTGDGQYGDVALTDPNGDPAGGGASDESTVALERELGTVGFNQFGGAGNTAGSTDDALDIAVVDVTNPELDLLPEVTDWSTPDDLSQGIASNVTAVGTAEFGGAEISHSGRTTGYAEGAYSEDIDPFLDYKGYLEVDGRLVKGFAAQIEVVPGDSGGTVLQGSTAVGVVTAYVNFTDGSKYLWASDLQTGLAATGGYSVLLDLAEPVVTSHESGAGIAWNGEISGTATAGDTLEYAFLPKGAEASFADSATTTVGDGGTWAITGPSTPGEYTVYLRTTDGGYNTSETVPFDVTVYPTAPEITSPAAGAQSTENVTAITGSAAPNAEITLSGDVNAELTADAEGAWSHAVDLGPGSYTVNATQTINGLASDPSTVEFAVGAAGPAFLNPVDGASYVDGDVPGTYTGTGVDGATVELWIDGQAAGSGTVEAGVWSIAPTIGLGVGDHEIAARQTIDGVASVDTVIGVSVTAAPVEPQPEQPNEAPESPAPGPQQPGDPDGPRGDELAPTGVEFNAAAPLAIGGGLVLAAGAVLLVVRARQRSRA